jgi:beta-phosphoglucomutase family hydrolase
MGRAALSVSPALLDAVVFDMDGVVTQTATVHAAAWKALFDTYLGERSQRSGEAFRPFDIEADYLPYVDGKARYDGVRDFLASRGITLPEGGPADPTSAETVCGLGNRKNGFFLQAVREQGVRPFPGTVRFIEQLHAAGVRTAIISASENTAMILEAAGVSGLFAARVDGLVARDLGLPGKPDPAVFLEAARRVDAAPDRAAVVEDALAGVRAGRAGGFALVIGVDRTAPQPQPGDDTPYICALPDSPGRVPACAAVAAATAAPQRGRTLHCRDLLDCGADIVVRDLSEVSVGS